MVGPEYRFKLIPRLGGLHISLFKGGRETYDSCALTDASGPN